MSLTEQEKLGITLFHKRKELSLLQGEVALMVGVEKTDYQLIRVRRSKKYFIVHTRKIGASPGLVTGRNFI